LTQSRNTTYAQFSKEVLDSVENHARRKGYINGDGIDGPRPLIDLKVSLGIATGHHMGEILSKLVEYCKIPRRVLLIKIGGWCFLEWRECKKE